MIWNSWADFFAMGGYALYVWGSIIVVAVCMSGEILALTFRRRGIMEQLHHAQRSAMGRKQRQSGEAGNENAA